MARAAGQAISYGSMSFEKYLKRQWTLQKA
jgi:hypothetical protein